MARAKKKKTKRKKAKARRKPAAKAPAHKPKAKKGAPASKGPDVERRWREYLKCRTDLEKAVAAVRAAEEELAAARQDERERREVFDQTKAALTDLLEVEPAGRSAQRSLLELQIPKGQEPKELKG